MNDELMQNLLKSLSKQERIILADMWESDIRPVLTKLFGQRQLQLAQQVLKVSDKHEYTVERRGAANELVEVVRLFSQNLKQVNKDRAARKDAE